MRPVGFFVFVFGTSLTLVCVHSKPAHSYNTFLLPNDIIRVKKRHDDLSTGYLEQCGIVTFSKAQRGVVNVLAFLDSSWPYSHRQAIMLKMLNDRLRRSGLPDTLFFVVNVDPSSARTVNNAEDDLEREAWLGVSPNEIESFSDIVKTADSLARSMTPDIQLIQDNEDLQIWKELRGSRDQVLVIDRCGKLTYQVIVPWSILHFPYVKAAILSTYKDEPCGPCDVINDTRDPFGNRDETTPQGATQDSDMELVSTTEEYFQNDREGHLPVTTESDLKGVLESTDTSQSGSTPMYLSPKVIDVPKATTCTTTRYTTMDPNTEDQEEFTTDDTKPIGPQATDHIDLVISDPLNDHKGPSRDTTDGTFYIQKAQILPSMDQSVILQNTDIDLLGLEESDLAMGSTNLSNSDTTGPPYPVSNYDTTATIYMKGHDEDTTAGKSSDLPATTFLANQEKSSSSLNSNATESDSFVNSDTIESTSFINSESAKSTSFITTDATESTSFTNIDATKSTYTVHHYNTTATICTKNCGEDAGVEKSLESPLFDIPQKSSILNDGEDTEISVENESTTMFIITENDNWNSDGKKSSADGSSTSKNIIVDTTTENTINSNTAIVFEIEEETNENKDSKGVFNENSDTEDTTLSSGVPIRIIMHAPHFHVDGDSTRMHEYLVLKTGSSDYHRHLSSYDATRSYRDPQDFREKPEYLRNQEIVERMWSMTNVIYNRDESPGLYGEVADYWKNSGGQDNNYDYNEGTETSGVEQNIKESNADDRTLKKPLKTSDQSDHENGIAKQESTVLDDGPDKSTEITDRPQADSADKNTSETQAWNDETLDAEEEEMRSKLIAHYSKLLPWIYYVLD